MYPFYVDYNFHSRGPVPDTEENVILSAIDDADVLHLDGNYLKGAIFAAKYAREKGVKVSLDAGGLYANIEVRYGALTKKSNIPEAMAELSARYNPEI